MTVSFARRTVLMEVVTLRLRILRTDCLIT